MCYPILSRVVTFLKNYIYVNYILYKRVFFFIYERICKNAEQVEIFFVFGFRPIKSKLLMSQCNRWLLTYRGRGGKHSIFFKTMHNEYLCMINFWNKNANWCKTLNWIVDTLKYRVEIHVYLICIISVSIQFFLWRPRCDCKIMRIRLLRLWHQSNYVYFHIITILVYKIRWFFVIALHPIIVT